jgi:hypothetical protein
MSGRYGKWNDGWFGPGEEPEPDPRPHVKGVVHDDDTYTVKKPAPTVGVMKKQNLKKRGKR